MSSLAEIMDALADQIQDQLSGTVSPQPIEDLQVVGRLHLNPTPPSIDVYPADPFQQAIAFGGSNNEMFLAVRARVSTADHEAGQELLLSMMDPDANTSIAPAILEDPTLGGKVEDVSVDGPTDFGLFPDLQNPTAGALLGCTWTVRVTP